MSKKKEVRFSPEVTTYEVPYEDRYNFHMLDKYRSALSNICEDIKQKLSLDEIVSLQGDTSVWTVIRPGSNGGLKILEEDPMKH